jgi:hypothetical protein
MNKNAKRRLRVEMSKSLLFQVIDSLKSDQTLDDRVEELLAEGMNYEDLQKVAEP